MPTPEHSDLYQRSGFGIAVPDCRSIAIDRVRRKHQRLTSCLLIENAPLASTAAPEPFTPGHFRSRLTTIRTGSKSDASQKAVLANFPVCPQKRTVAPDSPKPVRNQVDSEVVRVLGHTA